MFATMTSNALDTAAESAPAIPIFGLVLMGGGARTAYQVGVLRGLASMLRQKVDGIEPAFPFKVLVGTSAGALNTAFLAGVSTQGFAAFDQLVHFWAGLRSAGVYELDVSPWARRSRIIAALSITRHARKHGAVLNNMPLVNTLHRAVSMTGIDQALQSGTLNALAVTASSYTSGVHWTFCQTAHDSPFRVWTRNGRRADFQPVTIEHLMASSAIPFIFPATPLWVDGRREYFGDGSMRQVSPLSPALHLGADRILVVGVGQPQRAGLAGGDPSRGVVRSSQSPSIGGIAGHAMASVFHDTLQADVEQTQRINDTLRMLSPEAACHLPYRPVEVLALQPSQSLDSLAQTHIDELPAGTRNALGGLGALKGGGAALASYLLFEPGFVHALMALGEKDAHAKRAELTAFFSASRHAAVP